MSTPNFYAELPALTNFLDLTDPANYVDVPEDWYVLVADIAGSTPAIAAGKYKEVNFLGACSIIAVLNAIAPADIPFLFGGDGASLVVPPSHLLAAKTALLGVRELARSAFELELRVGAVSVAIVRAHYPLKVARYRFSPTYRQASFIGGGISYAAERIKADGTYRWDAENSSQSPNLSGLECRWQEVPSPQGQTLSAIVQAIPKARVSEDAIYRSVLEEIQRLYGEAQSYHPISISALKLGFSPHQVSAEVKARSPAKHALGRLLYWLRVVLENLLGAAFMHFGLRVGEVDWGNYKAALQAATDYQKIDDALRMTIASSPTRTEALRQYLERRFLAGELVYGLHVSDRALLTCLIFEQRRRHLHFIDGADGGYTLAAKALKQRLAAR